VVGHADWQRAKEIAQEKAYIASLAEAGATWWSMYISPDAEEVMAKVIQEGPPRFE